MRANFTAPALTTWLIVSVIICLVWSVPWYVGALGGLAAAAVVYWALRTMEPEWNLIPEWVWNFISAILFAGLALATPPRPPSLDSLTWLFAFIAVVHLSSGVRGYLSRHKHMQASSE